MLKKINKLILVIILILLFMSVEIYIIRKATNIETKSQVIVVVKDIDRGSKITDDMVIEKKMNIFDIPSGAVSLKSNIIGKYAKQDIYKGQIAINKELVEEDPNKHKYQLEKDNVMVTIEFTRADSANGWILVKDQRVNLVYSPKTTAKNLNEIELDEYDQVKVIKTKIIEIKDKNLNNIKETNMQTFKPQYITFETTRKIAEFIINAKDKGRFEIYVGEI